MAKRFLVLDLATGTIDAAITAAVQAAIAAAPASNAIKITVANQAARYALTPVQVQNGDYVFQTDTATLYEVIVAAPNFRRCRQHNAALVNCQRMTPMSLTLLAPLFDRAMLACIAVLLGVV
jgi:hypothetical protein